MRNAIRILATTLVIGMLSTCILAQNSDTVDINGYLQKLRKIDHYVHDQDWKQASALWREVIAMNPVDGEVWYRYGESLYRTDEPARAIDAFKNSMRIGMTSLSPADAAYAISKCYAKTHDAANALEWLKKSFDLGYRYLAAPTRDSVFGFLAHNEAFQNIVGAPAHGFVGRDEGWRFDLRLLVREIKRRRIHLPTGFSIDRLDSAAAALDESIPGMTDIQITLGFMRIVTLANDGHSMVYAFFERPEIQKNLPFNMFFFREGLYITEADRRYADLVGNEILAIDDLTIAQLMKGLDPILNRDNEMGPRISGIFRMRTIPLLFGLGLVKSPDKVELTVRDLQGKIRKLSIVADCPIPSRKLWDGLPESWVGFYDAKGVDPPDYYRNQFKPYWFRYVEENQVVYFGYNRVTSEGVPFEHFCDSLFDLIKRNKVDKLIIDIRLNNGGNTHLVPYLISKINAATEINRYGHLFVIIGRRTFSAAQNLASLMERFTQATFIGEPTGSSPNFIGEENPFELPYSKLMVNISDQYWESSWPTDTREWTTPLIFIDPSFKDFALGRDPTVLSILSAHTGQ
jgi:tetratricopeptide (TPR) repeat protein